MEYLINAGKNRFTHTNMQDSTHGNALPVIDDNDIDNNARGYESLTPDTNEGTKSESVEKEIPSKKVNDIIGWLLFQLIEVSGRIAKILDELRQRLLGREQSSQHNQSDTLLHFFLFMYNTTKGLPTKYQRQVRNKVYKVVTQAENQHECEFSRDAISHDSCSTFSSNTIAPPLTTPTDIHVSLNQQFPEFFYPQPTVPTTNPVQLSPAGNFSNYTMYGGLLYSL